MTLKIRYTIATTRPEYLRGETPFLSLILRNEGTETGRIPRPGISPNVEFSLLPPDPQLPLCADPIHGIRTPAEDPIPESELSQAVLQPGQEWTGGISLGRLFPMEENGSYRISSVILLEGEKVASNTQEFKIDEARILQMSAAPLGAGDPNAVRLVSLSDKGKERGLLYDTWHLGGGEDAAPERVVLTEIRSLPSPAMDPVGCATPHSVGSDGFTFTFWREGDAAFAVAGGHPINRTLKLPGAVDRLLEPALLDRGHIAHLYALTTKNGAATLVIARFIDHLIDPNTPEKVLAERPLAAPPAAVAVAIDETNKQPRRLLVMTRMEGPAPRFDWMSYAGDAVPEGFHSHVWAKMVAAEKVPDSRPAVLGLAEGSVRTAWVVREASQPRHGLLLEATFDAAGKLLSESTTTLATESPIRAARIAYLGGLPFTVVWTDDGKIQAWTGTEFRTVVEKSSGKLPPLLCILRESSYVIEADAVKGTVLVHAK